MSFRNSVVTAATAAVLCIPLALTAQDTTARRDTTKRTTVTQRQTFSQQRVRVQKDYGTDVRATPVPNADSIAAAARKDSIDRAMQHERDSLAALERAKADSIARIEKMRSDSIAEVNRIEAARRDSIARADSIALEQQRLQQLNRPHMRGGWYLGVSGGGTMPRGDFKSLGYDNGFDVNVPIGYHKPSSLLGFRVDLGYSQFGARSFIGSGAGGTSVTLSNSKPKVLSATLNLTARAPLTSSRKLALYGVGGAGVYHFRNYGATSALSGFLGNDVFDNADETIENSKTKIGAQVGGGLDWAVGSASIFVESRFVNVFADRGENVQFNDFFGANRSKNVRWVPIVLGITIR